MLRYLKLIITNSIIWKIEVNWQGKKVQKGHGLDTSDYSYQSNNKIVYIEDHGI